MPGTRARDGVKGGGFRELASGVIDAEDADEISSKIWDDNEGVCWIHKGFVGMGSVLAVRIRTRF